MITILHNWHGQILITDETKETVYWLTKNQFQKNTEGIFHKLFNHLEKRINLVTYKVFKT